MGSHDVSRSRRWVLLGILCLGAFTTALNVTLLSPLLTLIADDFAVGEAKTGQLATLTAGMSAVTALVVAPWMDRYSRGAWMRLECVLLASGSLFSALAPDFAWLFVARVVCGIGGAVIGANCLAAVGDLFADPHERNRALALVSTAFTLGAIFGLPVLTQIADVGGWRWAIAGPAPLAAIVFLGSFLLPRTAHAPATGPLWRGWAAGYARVLQNRETVWLLASLVALMVVWFGYLIYLRAYGEEVFAIGAGTLSLLYLFGGGAEIAGNNVTPPLLRRFSARSVALVAAAILGLDLVAVGIVYTHEWGLFPFNAIASATGAVVFVCTSILIIDSLPAARGAVMSLQSAGLEAGGAVGVALTGAAIAILNDYEAVYRLLGLSVPVAMFCLLMSARHSAEAEVGEPAAATG